MKDGRVQGSTVFAIPSWIVYAQCRPVPVADGDYAANLQRVGVVSAPDATKFDVARQKFGIPFPVLERLLSNFSEARH